MKEKVDFGKRECKMTREQWLENLKKGDDVVIVAPSGVYFLKVTKIFDNTIYVYSRLFDKKTGVYNTVMGYHIKLENPLTYVFEEKIK